MCTIVVTPAGEWLHSPDELEAFGIPVADEFLTFEYEGTIHHCERDECFCCVDVEGILNAAGRKYVEDCGFYELEA